MHPELLSSLVAERQRDVAASRRPRTVRTPAPGEPRRAPAPRRLVPRRLVPSLRVSWTHTTLAAAAGRRRGRSWVIIISATRPL